MDLPCAFGPQPALHVCLIGPSHSRNRKKLDGLQIINESSCPDISHLNGNVEQFRSTTSPISPVSPHTTHRTPRQTDGQAVPVPPTPAIRTSFSAPCSAVHHVDNVGVNTYGSHVEPAACETRRAEAEALKGQQRVRRVSGPKDEMRWATSSVSCL